MFKKKKKEDHDLRPSPDKTWNPIWKIIQAINGWENCSSGKTTAYQVQRPEFKPQNSGYLYNFHPQLINVAVTSSNSYHPTSHPNSYHYSYF
jgi:hypothetical protein